MSGLHSLWPSPGNCSSQGPINVTSCTEAAVFCAPGPVAVSPQVKERQKGTNSPARASLFLTPIVHSPSPPLPHVRSHDEMQTGVQMDEGRKTNTFFFPSFSEQLACERHGSKGLWNLPHLILMRKALIPALQVRLY